MVITCTNSSKVHVFVSIETPHIFKLKLFSVEGSSVLCVNKFTFCMMLLVACLWSCWQSHSSNEKYLHTNTLQIFTTNGSWGSDT